MAHKMMSYLIEYCKIKLYIKKCQNISLHSLLLPQTEAIDISIIIPVFNQWHLTRVCINSVLLSCNGMMNYELILADDCSTDETNNAYKYYPGIKTVRTTHNVGFLRNCNHAAQQTQGKYIVLLNNDTIVLPHWLDSLYHTIERDRNIAIIGSKILNPTGTIREAGKKLFNDGTSKRIGGKKNRKALKFNIPREVDYISGCSIMIRKPFWEAVNGFDTRYFDAYYEDLDLALMAKMLKMKVFYQPQSEIIHLVSQSYQSRKEAKGQTFLKNNQQAFLNKWQETLKYYPSKK